MERVRVCRRRRALLLARLVTTVLVEMRSWSVVPSRSTVPLVLRLLQMFLMAIVQALLLLHLLRALPFSFLIHVTFVLVDSMPMSLVFNCRYYLRIHFSTSSDSIFCSSGVFDAAVQSVDTISSAVPPFAVNSDFASYFISTTASFFSYDGTALSYSLPADQLLLVFSPLLCLRLAVQQRRSALIHSGGVG